MTSQTISKICSVEGCELGPLKGRGLERGMCRKHYKRWLKYGDPHKTVRTVVSSCTREEAFWARVDKTPGYGRDGECWEWTGYRNENGYGRLGYASKDAVAHRVAWLLTYGAEPSQDLLHSCDNPPCCNPKHLREGTPADNTADKVERGRHLFGEDHPNAILTTDKVIQIKNVLLSSKATLSQIAKECGVSKGAVADIKYGKIWKHVTI